MPGRSLVMRVLWFGALCGATLAAQSSAVRPLVDKEHRRMQPEAAIDFSRGNTIVVAGDPSKPGLYVIRRLFKPGETSTPHFHDQDRYVTVIKGTWYTGEGNVKDAAKMVPIRTGGFMLHSAGLHHYDGSNDAGDVIVQIIGMGPVKTTDVDAQGKSCRPAVTGATGARADLHVVFGAGQVGYPLAQQLMAAGKRVRIAKRSAAHVPSGCEVIAGDAADPAFCATATAGATVVYHCMNPPYDARIWADLLPRYMENLIAASTTTGARLVVLDNVYMLGRSNGRALNEDSPMNPSSRKGEIRALVTERLFDAHRRGDVVATSGRASDFYGPGGTQTGLGDFFWPRVLAGKKAYVPFALDAVHTYHYIPDVAMGLATLGCAGPDIYGKPWMLPCTPAGTMRDLIARVGTHLDRPVRVGQVPSWVTQAAAFVVPLMRELAEMAYQWEEPFVVDDSRFRARFDVRPIGVDLAAGETARWAVEHYRSASPA